MVVTGRRSWNIYHGFAESWTSNHHCSENLIALAAAKLVPFNIWVRCAAFHKKDNAFRIAVGADAKWRDWFGVGLFLRLKPKA